jgi:hypothetical protein
MNATEFALQLLKFSTSIAKSRDADDEVGALILFYAYTDALGSLLRPKGKRNTSSIYFKRYAREFILDGTSLAITEDDLWSARCGMLHTFSPYSDLTEGPTPRARKVAYVKSNQQAHMANQAVAAANLGDIICVDSFDLFNAFIDGVVRFRKKVADDPVFAESIFFHAEKFFQDTKIWPPNQPLF